MLVSLINIYSYVSNMRIIYIIFLYMSRPNSTQCTRAERQRQTKTLLDRQCKWGHDFTWTKTGWSTGLDKWQRALEVRCQEPMI